MERGAALAGTGMRPRPTSPAPVIESKPEPKPEVIFVSQEQKPSALKKDWGSLLSRSAQKLAAVAPTLIVNDDLLAQVVAATNDSRSTQTAEPSLPAGFQDGFVLSSLVQSRQPISGLVVSIGVKASGAVPQSVHELVQSLIGPNDFAAQSSEDEFLLIYPEERGASAQRRLSQIAQQLWDFQLRSLGSFQILFSWGGVEVRSESIEEAIASASERMQETKRGRKLLTMWSPAPPTETQLRRAGEPHASAWAVFACPATSAGVASAARSLFWHSDGKSSPLPAGSDPLRFLRRRFRRFSANNAGSGAAASDRPPAGSYTRPLFSATMDSHLRILQPARPAKLPVRRSRIPCPTAPQAFAPSPLLGVSPVQLARQPSPDEPPCLHAFHPLEEAEEPPKLVRSLKAKPGDLGLSRPEGPRKAPPLGAAGSSCCAAPWTSEGIRSIR